MLIYINMFLKAKVYITGGIRMAGKKFKIVTFPRISF